MSYCYKMLVEFPEELRAEINARAFADRIGKTELVCRAVVEYLKPGKADKFSVKELCGNTSGRRKVAVPAAPDYPPIVAGRSAW